MEGDGIGQLRGQIEITMPRKPSLTWTRRDRESSAAVLFLHGFTGNQDDTWESFPSLLGTRLQDWDICSLGYPTTLLPDVAGVWSADPDLPLLADRLYTELVIPPLSEYARLALVAHSMGGLIVQRALVDREDLVQRVSHFVQFGTPSSGVVKASWIRFWKRSLRNMAAGSDFLRDLRSRWDRSFDSAPPFLFLTVAGTKDQFVPRSSSLDPFPREVCRVVDGNHLAVVKPRADDASLRLLVDALSTTPEAGAQAVYSEPEPPPLPTVPTEDEVVRQALALDHAGRRDDSVALLESHRHLGTDVMGTLVGRYKRMWLETEDIAFARKAQEEYSEALSLSLRDGTASQVYYHAINLGFLELVAFHRADVAREHAERALRHAALGPENVWSVATKAEANLYLGDLGTALELYRRVAVDRRAEIWQLGSVSEQAVHVATTLEDERLVAELDAIFSPGGKKVFVSYSHRDRDWLDRLKILLKPYLEDAHIEFWGDSAIRPGDDWREKIEAAKAAAGVAVALASSSFLASDFVKDEELPDIVAGARSGEMVLIWVALDPAGYEVSPLWDFQAVNDPARPLTGLDHHEQQEVLLDVARKIKEAAQPS